MAVHIDVFRICRHVCTQPVISFFLAQVLAHYALFVHILAVYFLCSDAILNIRFRVVRFDKVEIIAFGCYAVQIVCIRGVE